MQPTPLYSPQPIIIGKAVAALYFILIHDMCHFYRSKINAAYSSLLSAAHHGEMVAASYFILIRNMGHFYPSKINAAYSSLLSTAYHGNSSCFMCYTNTQPIQQSQIIFIKHYFLTRTHCLYRQLIMTMLTHSSTNRKCMLLFKFL